MKETKIYCDMKDCKQKATNEQYKIQVIFTTEQTEGRSTEPHLCNENLDLCDDCLNHVLKGNYIFGAGAQGYNKYWFKTAKN